MAEELKGERIAHLEATIRYYAASARRWEGRCLALELELAAAQERLAQLGYRNYSAMDD